MALMVLDRAIEKRLKAEREASGLDRYDEVWEGVYMMAPLANNEHQDLQFELASAIKRSVEKSPGIRVHAGANVSDRERDWTSNYRILDVAVVFPTGRARDCDTHWCGGPDFCAEIASPGDCSRDKLDFYASVGVRELLIVDRNPWSIELFRLDGTRMVSVGISQPSESVLLDSVVLPLTFCLRGGTPRPKIEVVHRDGVQRWSV